MDDRMTSKTGGTGTAGPRSFDRLGADLYRQPERSYFSFMRFMAVLLVTTASTVLPISSSASEERILPVEEAEATAPVETPHVGDTAENDMQEGSVEGEILVKFQDAMSAEQIEAINRRLGVAVINTMLDGKLFLVETPYPNVVSQLIGAYQATEGVEYAEPNSRVSIPRPPEDSDTEPRDPDGGSGGLPPSDDGRAPLMPLPGTD